MLRRKKQVDTFREPTRTEFANIIPLTDSRYASQEDSERVLKDLEERTMNRIKKAVERFLSSPEIEDLAKFNDLILRAYLKLPARVRETQQGPVFFDKIRRTANQIMVARKSSIDRAHEDTYAVQLLDASADEMAKNLLSLESSVMQLARFVSSQALTHPDRVFATGVNLDVRYGIDLIGADVMFDQEHNQLVVHLILWQAKASRVGMSADDVRGLSQRYTRQQQAVVKELEFDASWVQEHLLDRRPEPKLELDDDTAFEIVAGEIEQLTGLHRKLDELSPQDRFLAELRVYRLLETCANEFEVKVPESVVRPKIVVGGIEFRYLVDTKQGARDLSKNDANSFGIAA